MKYVSLCNERMNLKCCRASVFHIVDLFSRALERNEIQIKKIFDAKSFACSTVL